MRSSYRLRSITDRTTLAGGSTLPAAQQGPPVSTQYPLGYYLEDFEYVAGLGDLDEHNGRLTVTPDYPDGIYAYFVTLDESGTAAFPYVLGTTYYGTVAPGNTGPQSGHNVPTEPVVRYTPSRVPAEAADIRWSIAPNPASGSLQVAIPATGSGWKVSLVDLLGQEVVVKDNLNGGEIVTLALDGVAEGAYVVRLERAGSSRTRMVVVGR